MAVQAKEEAQLIVSSFVKEQPFCSVDENKLKQATR
jgi:hypothetical protein